jgi:hypothetical protein
MFQRSRLTQNIFLIFTISMLIFTPACKKKEDAGSDSRESFNAESDMAGYHRQKDKEAPAAEALPDEPSTRKVIVTHSLSLEVRNLSSAFRSVIDLAAIQGGYTTETGRMRNDDGSYAGSVAMRVPPGSVGGLLEKLRGFGKVISENSTGEDITDEYVDLEARLKNMRASEARLQELLARRTQKLADVLAVEKELTRVRGDIESFEAQKRNWELLTKLVTIRIELVELKGAFPALYRIWTPIRTAFGGALEAFAESLHAVVVFMGTIIPWAALLGLPVYLYFKVRRKKHLTSRPVN